VGQVVQIGSSVQKFREGDTVIVPFSSSCGKAEADRVTSLTSTGECFYCEKGYTARCQSARAYGTPAFEGAQAEYFKIDMADSCVFKAPYDLPRELLVLMTDIIPTGYSVAQNARTLLDTDGPRGRRGEVCVVIGCGPVSRRAEWSHLP
jgi:threonine dehydrogenase-like Zn-dependent dehydrogenase